MWFRVNFQITHDYTFICSFKKLCKEEGMDNNILTHSGKLSEFKKSQCNVEGSSMINVFFILFLSTYMGVSLPFRKMGILNVTCGRLVLSTLGGYLVGPCLS